MPIAWTSQFPSRCQRVTSSMFHYVISTLDRVEKVLLPLSLSHQLYIMSANEEATPAGGEETAPVADVETIVKGLQEVHDATALENALSTVKPGIGNCKTRRKLKRAIEQVIGKEEIEKSMNAKVRRRVTRVIGFLAPNPEAQNEKKEEDNAENAKKAAASEAKDKAAAAAAAAAEQARHVPYVVFVGQLNFNTTADDLKAFFQSQNVNGSIKVRLLTNNEDSRSKGMAFVEVDNAAEMHKCIALHRSVLHGRMINIEKSCGGASKDKRRLKIQEKRSEQSSKVTETVQRIVAEYAASGTIDADNLGDQFKTKLFSCGPAIISKALHAYSKLPEEKRKIAKLDQLLDKFKEKDVVTL